jgi:hypothetical protein
VIGFYMRVLSVPDSFDLNGQSYAIRTGGIGQASGGHKKRTWVFMGGGGAVRLWERSGLVGVAIGAGVGAVAGTTTAFITDKKNVHMPVETPLAFRLRTSVDRKLTA